jgi:hypothetical protein
MNVSKFKKTVIKNSKKSPEDLFSERVDEFVERASIELETQIVTRETNLIPLLELELKKLTSEETNLNKELNNAKFSVPNNLDVQTWLSSVREVEKKLHQNKLESGKVSSQIETYKAEVVKLQEYKTFLNS